MAEGFKEGQIITYGTGANLDQEMCPIGQVICYKTHPLYMMPTHEQKTLTMSNRRWKKRRGEKEHDRLPEGWALAALQGA